MTINESSLHCVLKWFREKGEVSCIAVRWSRVAIAYGQHNIQRVYDRQLKGGSIIKVLIICPLVPPSFVNFIVVGGNKESNKERVDDWNAIKVLRKQIVRPSSSWVQLSL